MSPELWERPASDPESAGFDSDEGYPKHAGYTNVPRFYTSAAIRPGKRIKGCDFKKDGIISKDPWAIEGGVFDDYRRFLFDVYRRLMTLHHLAEGPTGWESGYTFNGEIVTNFTDVFEFAASGSGNELTVTWTATPDLRSLVHNGVSNAVQPGMWVIDNRAAVFGMYRIEDVVFLGEDGGTHSATIVLENGAELDAGRENKLWIIREDAIPVIPTFPLQLTEAERTDPLPCRHDVKVKHSILSSFKAAYPGADFEDGVQGARYCTKLMDPTTDLSTFQDAGRCANDACPNYVVHVAHVETLAEINDFFSAVGVYLLQTVGPTRVVGRHQWAGLLALIGLPVGFFGEGLVTIRTYASHGVIKHRTGDQLASGYDEFQDWMEKQVALDPNEADDVGLLNGMSSQTVNDPAGGASFANRVLVDDDERTPGYDYEKETGVRRTGYTSVSSPGNVSGPGDSEVQRVRPRNHTSAPFTLPDTGETVTEETRLTLYGSPQALGGDSAFAFDLMLEIPRFSESIVDQLTPGDKSLTPAIAAVSISDDLLTLEFDLGTNVVAFFDAGIPGTDTMIYDTGGNVVCAENAHMVWNPSSGDKIGDRQLRLYPGDAITFDHVDLAGVVLMCLAAEAFGGASVGGQTEPDARATGVPGWLTAGSPIKAHYRDKAVFSLEGQAGEIVKKFDDDTGLVGIDIASIGHGAVSPPAQDFEGTATNYEPAISKVTGGATETPLTAWDGATGDFVYDPALGKVFIDTSGFSEGVSTVIYFDGWVFDIRPTHPVVNVLAMDEALTSVCEGYHSEAYGATAPVDIVAVDTTIRTPLGGPPDPPSTHVPRWIGVMEDTGTDGSVSSESDLLYNTIPGTTATTELDREFWKTSGPNLAPPKFTIGVFRPVPVGVPDRLIQYYNELPVIPLRSVLPRCATQYIRKATFDMTFGGADYMADEFDFDRSGAGLIHTHHDLNASSIPLSMAAYLFKDDGAGDYDIRPSGIAVPTSWNRIGGTGYAATADVTSIIKFVKENGGGDEGEWIGLMLVGPNSPGSEGSHKSFALSWLDGWSETWQSGLVETYYMYVRYFQFDSASVDSLRVQFAAEELGNGPVPHFDDVGQAPMPDLLTEFPP